VIGQRGAEVGFHWRIEAILAFLSRRNVLAIGMHIVVL
jgi:hypothetical protein